MNASEVRPGPLAAGGLNFTSLNSEGLSRQGTEAGYGYKKKAEHWEGEAS